MADTDRDQRTEDATARRLDRERAQGNVAYSREVSSALLLLGFVSALRIFGEDVAAPLRGAFRSALSLESASLVTVGGYAAAFSRIAGPALFPAALLLISAAAVAAFAGFGQLGVSFDMERLGVRWSKLNPIAGFGKLFNRRALMTVFTGAAKVAVVARLAWDSVSEVATALSAAPVVSLKHASGLVLEAALDLGFRVGLFLAALATFDFFWKKFLYKRDTRMTKQEVKEEHKQEEGDAAVKGEIKRRMRALARQKMIGDVKKASVVIRNPTHFAVALRYDKKEEFAPRLLAKGADKLALRIIAEAEKHKVPVVSKPEVAREIFRTVKVGAMIPPVLYKAAAAILAYVARRRRAA
jgi:flagellar biosynthesis protein FlhB